MNNFILDFLFGFISEEFRGSSDFWVTLILGVLLGVIIAGALIKKVVKPHYIQKNQELETQLGERLKQVQALEEKNDVLSSELSKYEKDILLPAEDMSFYGD